METIYDFNGRLLPMKTYKQIYEQLAKDREKLLYKCVAETPEGESFEFYQPLSDEDVRALLDDEDVRALLDDDDDSKPAEILDWTETKERFAREEGLIIEVKDVSLSVYLKFTCHFVDEQMTSIPYSVIMPIHDYVYIVDCVDTYTMLDVRGLQDFRTDLYELLTDSKNLPRPLTPTTRLLLTSAEETLGSIDEEYLDWMYTGEIYHTDHGANTSSHLIIMVMGSGIALRTYEVLHYEIFNTGELSIDDPAKFRQCLGAYYVDSLKNAVKTMYGGLDADLKHIAEFCDKNEIAYTWDK